MTGPTGIIPTRGQVLALRATAPTKSLTKCSWDGNEGFEYWFPRPVSDESDENPLVILGGGREVQSPDFEYYQTDDASLNPRVGAALRKFLPTVFPGKFAHEQEPEQEWVRPRLVLGFI
jgi:hypothetical protein